MPIKFIPLIIFIITFFSSYATEIDLSDYEKSFYSQHGEDGVLSKIIELLDPYPRFFLELGANNRAIGSNSYLLRLQGWGGLSMNRLFEKPKSNIFKEFITAENVNELLAKHKTHGFYLLIIDMSYNDFYIWKAIKPKYEPALVMIRYNGTHLPHQDKIVKYHPYYCGDGTDYFGASILALYNLGKSRGYSLVYADQTGANLFFIKDDILKEKNLSFKNMNDVEKLYRYPTYGIDQTQDYRKDAMQRPYLSSSDLIESKQLP